MNNIYQVRIINGANGWVYFYNDKNAALARYQDELEEHEGQRQYYDINLSVIQTNIPFEKFKAYQKDSNGINCTSPNMREYLGVDEWEFEDDEEFKSAMDNFETIESKDNYEQIRAQ